MTTSSFTIATPFIKWVGGKSRLIKQIWPYLPASWAGRRYFEPFLGSAALFFFIRPFLTKPAFLSDQNPYLINLYQVVRDCPEDLIDALNVYNKCDNPASYYKIRNSEPPQDRIKLAAWFFYLNRTSYNGLYRENSKGRCNSAFGGSRGQLLTSFSNIKLIRSASIALKNCDIVCTDFENIEETIKKGDFVYFDPPYQTNNSDKGFNGYSKNRFNIDKQKQLADLIKRLNQKGVLWLASNSATPLIFDLYRKFKIYELETTYSIRPTKNQKVKELLIAGDWYSPNRIHRTSRYDQLLLFPD